MKIEVVEFYPLLKMAKHGKIGTLHVFVADYNLDIRGINVFFRKNRLYFFTPSITFLDPKSKSLVSYPIVNLAIKDSKKTFIREMRNAGNKYVRANYKLPMQVPLKIPCSKIEHLVV